MVTRSFRNYTLVAVDDLNMGMQITVGDTLHHREWGLTNFVHTLLAVKALSRVELKIKYYNFLNKINFNSIKYK